MHERINAWTHAAGVILATAALAVLVTFAALRAGAKEVTALSIFGSCLVILYLMSTIYHALPQGRTKRVFQTLDHAAIYLLIAGTYTPVTLLVLPSAWGWSVFGVIWGCTVVGITLQVLKVKLRGGTLVLPYLVMGWFILIAFGPLREALPFHALFWLIVGGALYSMGAFFFATDQFFPLKRSITLHNIFHVFTMLGSASHVWFLFWFVLPHGR